MPILRCYVGDEAYRLLEKASEEMGRAIEELATAAIENAAIEYKVDCMKRSPQETATPPDEGPWDSCPGDPSVR